MKGDGGCDTNCETKHRKTSKKVTHNIKTGLANRWQRIIKNGQETQIRESTQQIHAFKTPTRKTLNAITFQSALT